MTSINPNINSLHAAYCEASGREIALNAVFERYWFEADKMGVKPDDVKLVFKHRLSGVSRQERRENCLLIRNFCGSDEAISSVIEEAAAIRAKMRIKTIDKGKAEVLRSTGRSDQPTEEPMRHISEVMEQMRKASGK